jgi:alpha-ketoglutarate-dependent taurine dioxygenase
MSIPDVKKLSPWVGAEVLDVNAERLRDDEALGSACLDALDQHGILVFRAVFADDATQIAFCRKLGEIEVVPENAVPEVTVISLEPSNRIVQYIPSSFLWHIDGIHSAEAYPAKATSLSAHVLGKEGGGTEFASTYAAYETLSETEKARLADLHVVFTLEKMQRQIYPDPTPEQLADWARRPDREHPLVWEHRSGRRSLVVDASATYIAELDREEGEALVADLLARMTAPDRVFRHEWSAGDMIIWDNRGLVHRAVPYDPTSAREMRRVQLLGVEPVKARCLVGAPTGY